MRAKFSQQLTKMFIYLYHDLVSMEVDRLPELVIDVSTIRRAEDIVLHVPYKDHRCHGYRIIRYTINHLFGKATAVYITMTY